MTTAHLTPYLFFSGRAEEAIAFYRQALGAEVQMKMLHRESPDAPPPGMLQPGWENKVMHATLRVAGCTLMLSDGCDDKSRFSGFSLSLAWPTEADARRAFDALAVGGQVGMPLCKTFWSPCFGMLTDKFGVGWMISVLAPAA